MQVEEPRARELQALAVRKYLDALCVYFWAATSLLMSVLTFALFVLLGHTLTAEVGRQRPCQPASPCRTPPVLLTLVFLSRSCCMPSSERAKLSCDVRLVWSCCMMSIHLKHVWVCQSTVHERAQVDFTSLGCCCTP
jgi:hypothetical protein